MTAFSDGHAVEVLFRVPNLLYAISIKFATCLGTSAHNLFMNVQVRRSTSGCMSYPGGTDNASQCGSICRFSAVRDGPAL